MLNDEHNKYSATTTINASIATKISQQYCDLKFVISEKVESGMIKSFTDMLNYMHRNEEFEELSILVHICGTFLACSAECESRFSVIRSIKCKSNRVEADHLDDLRRIKTYRSLGCEINLDNVYSPCISNKDR